MTIDIIGGGIGGLTTGLFLKKKGFRVRVFEQAKEIKPVGAGIILASNAMQVYQKLSLSDKITTKGHTVSAMSIVDEKLKVISESSLLGFEEKYQLKNTAIHRGVLQKILVDEFEQEELFLDHQLKEIEKQKESKYILKFNDDKTYTSETIIAADGIDSKVRELLFDDVNIRKANQLCWRGVLNYNLPKYFHHKAVECWEKGTRFGFVKIDENKLYWYALKTINKQIKQDIDRNDFKNYNSLITDVLNKTENKAIHTSEMMDVEPFKNWSIGNVCLLGDAAHATTPNLGQGACQAIEDAYVVSECLSKHKPELAFKEFEKLRLKKAHKIVTTSFQVGKISHLSNSLLIFLRNNFFRMIPQSVNKKQLEFIFKLNNL